MCALPLSLLIGSSNMTTSEQSTLSGGALGAIGGAMLGSLSGHAGEGALIGAGVGAMTGAVLDEDRQRGEEMRQAESRYAQQEGKHLHHEYHHYYDVDGNEIEVIEEEYYSD
jgi:hypothetical protein